MSHSGRRKKFLQFSLLSMLGLMLLAAIISSKIGADYREAQRDRLRIVPTAWDLSTGKNVRWRVMLGTSTWRAPVVDSERVYVGTNNANQNWDLGSADMGVLACFQKSDGKLMWRHGNAKLPEGRVFDWPMQGITSRPCVEGDRLWYITNRCEVVCLDTEGFHDRQNDGPVRDEVSQDITDADVIWQLDMIGQLGVHPHNVSTCTVAVWEDQLFAVTGNGVSEGHVRALPDPPSFIALDKRSGKVLWTDNSPGKNILHGQWGSPVVAKLGGRMQVIFPGGDGWLYSFDPRGTKEGKSILLWKFDCNPKDAVWKLGGRGTRNNLLHGPTVHGGLLYIAVGHDPEHGEGSGRLWCIDPTGSGDVSPELVFNERDPSTPIPHRRVQACVESQGDFTRPNPNAKAIWQFDKQDVNGNGKIELEETMSRSLSTIAIKDDVLFVSDTTGILHCLDRKTGKQHWAYDLLSCTYATPVIAGQHVYLGTEDGDVFVLGCSADPKVAMPKGAASVPTMQCDDSIYGSVVVDHNVLYLVTRKELIAVAQPKPAE